VSFTGSLQCLSRTRRHTLRAAVLLASSLASAAPAQTDDAAELAKRLQNPIAAHVVVPLQSDYDRGLGPNCHGWQYKLNVQPVVPFAINGDWNLISRTVMTAVAQHVIDGATQTGLGDMLQSLFLSPQAPTAAGWIWGIGPALLLPTATRGVLGNEKWGAGPTAAVLRQEHGWTYGVLAHHIWSFAGRSSQPHIQGTYVQPVLAYTTARETTYAINSESTYDWREKQWTAPVDSSIAQLVKMGDTPVQFELGYRYYLDRPVDGPHWGLRFTITLLFGK
jgi:hypothetical protein